MPRINVEDSLFTDPRFQFLVEKLGRHAALGCCVQAFMTAQQFYLNEETKRMIPLKEWKKRMLSDFLIEAGLAEVREGDLIYVEGSTEQFSWLLERQEAGKRGGLAKASKALANPSKRKQNVASSSSSSSSSSSNININTENLAEKCLDAVEKFGPDSSKELEQFMGKEMYLRIARTVKWSYIRTLARNDWTAHNLSKKLAEMNQSPAPT